MSRFAARVISAARSARRGLSAESPRLRSASAASISARRVENASIVSRARRRRNLEAPVGMGLLDVVAEPDQARCASSLR